MQENEEVLNLSEKLFSRVRKVEETSTISNSAQELDSVTGEQVLIEGALSKAWYRILRSSFWIWQGADPIELEDVLSHIATGEGERCRPELLDTLRGYGPGNWIY